MSWPPPPHDPRERELVLEVAGWEVRVFGGRKFQYFVTRGFWHLQLWHPEWRISILTPSRLTCGFYEAYPVDGWKARAHDYARLASLLRREGAQRDAVLAKAKARLPSVAEVQRLERAFVDDLVRGANASATHATSFA